MKSQLTPREKGKLALVLEKIALHQTRLRTPGLSLDGRGIALGAKGLVLFPSMDRLVAWLSVYTRERSLEDMLANLRIETVRSKLGTQELVLSFAAESTDRMDATAETARLVGGFTFTGSARHFIQYRDASAPFGFDTNELQTTDASYVLYHEKFTQSYATVRTLPLHDLLLTLMPRPAPETIREIKSGDPHIVVAEAGLGPALIHYFVRSQVQAEVALGEWPPESAFDDGPTRRYLFRVAALPVRMRALLFGTPGITVFLPQGPSVAVEAGFRHPITLRACPVFAGLSLIRQGGAPPWKLDPIPVFGDVRAFARVDINLETPVHDARSSGAPDPVRVQLRLLPSTGAFGQAVTASFFPTAELGMFRSLAYALPRETLERVEIAITGTGVFLHSTDGIEGIPLGTYLTEIHPGLHLATGYDFVPKVAPEVLQQALNIPTSMITFLLPGAGGSERAIAVERAAFVPLETLLLEAPHWEPAAHETIERTLADAPIELQVEVLGLLPLRDV
jgi:hypothetical protein